MDTSIAIALIVAVIFLVTLPTFLSRFAKSVARSGADEVPASAEECPSTDSGPFSHSAHDDAPRLLRAEHEAAEFAPPRAIPASSTPTTLSLRSTLPTLSVVAGGALEETLVADEVVELAEADLAEYESLPIAVGQSAPVPTRSVTRSSAARSTHATRTALDPAMKTSPARPAHSHGPSGHPSPASGHPHAHAHPQGHAAHAGRARTEARIEEEREVLREQSATLLKSVRLFSLGLVALAAATLVTLGLMVFSVVSWAIPVLSAALAAGCMFMVRALNFKRQSVRRSLRSLDRHTTARAAARPAVPSPAAVARASRTASSESSVRTSAPSQPPVPEAAAATTSSRESVRGGQTGPARTTISRERLDAAVRAATGEASPAGASLAEQKAPAASPANRTARNETVANETVKPVVGKADSERAVAAKPVSAKAEVDTDTSADRMSTVAGETAPAATTTATSSTASTSATASTTSSAFKRQVIDTPTAGPSLKLGPRTDAPATQAVSEEKKTEEKKTAESSVAPAAAETAPVTTEVPAMSESNVPDASAPAADLADARPAKSRTTGTTTTTSTTTTGERNAAAASASVLDALSRRIQASGWTPAKLPEPTYVGAARVERNTPEPATPDVSSRGSVPAGGAGLSTAARAKQYADELGYGTEDADEEGPLTHGRTATRSKGLPVDDAAAGHVDSVLARRRA